MTTPAAAGVAAPWQAALAAEYQAVFGYGIVQAHLVPDSGDSPAFDLAANCGAAHESLTESISTAMLAANQTPQGPAADYPSLYPVESAKDAALLAIRLEDDCSTAWRALYAACAPQDAAGSQSAGSQSAGSQSAGSQSGGPHSPAPQPPAPKGLRATAQAALTDSAVRATRWRRHVGVTPLTQPFPGL
jgi:hypothetical protein